MRRLDSQMANLLIFTLDIVKNQKNDAEIWLKMAENEFDFVSQELIKSTEATLAVTRYEAKSAAYN